MAENDYPKTDGSIYYGSEANQGIYGRKGATTAYGAVSVANVATSIKAVNTGRVTLIVFNNSASIIYLGDATVTTATGYTLGISESRTIEDTEQIYGIVSAGTADLRYIEVTK